MENEFGFDNSNNNIRNDIYNNRHNHVTTTYNLLKQKYLEGRLIFNLRERLYNKISSKKKFQNEYKANITKNNEIFHKKSKTISKSESKRNIFSIKDIYKKNDFSDNNMNNITDNNWNNIIIINNTNMIQEKNRINSIYNNIILNKNSKKNIHNKIETSISQEKKIKEGNNEKIRNINYIKSPNNCSKNRINKKMNQIKVSLKKANKNINKFIYFKNVGDLNQNKKYIKLPIDTISFKTKSRNNNCDNILSHKKKRTKIMYIEGILIILIHLM